MPEWLRPSLREMATADVPLGQIHTSTVTGRVYASSDLGFVDVPDPYQPDWSLIGTPAEEGSCTQPQQTLP